MRGTRVCAASKSLVSINVSTSVALLFSSTNNPGVRFLFPELLHLHLLTTGIILIHTALRQQTHNRNHSSTYTVCKTLQRCYIGLITPLMTVRTQHTPPTPCDHHHRGEPTPEQQRRDDHRGSSHTGVRRA